MTKTLDELFEPVADAVENAILVAFDGCHKIYVAMDEEQADWFRRNYNSSNCSTTSTSRGLLQRCSTLSSFGGASRAV
jgi:hypothetical protein